MLFNTAPIVCSCTHKDEECFGSFEDYLAAYSRQIKVGGCNCELKGSENNGERYQLRKLRFTIDGDILIIRRNQLTKEQRQTELGRGNFIKAFQKGFPCQYRGIFMVIVNNNHCVVFDASRQIIIDSNYEVPIHFCFADRVLTTDGCLMTKLLGILGYNTITLVYQLYSKNSRFATENDADKIAMASRQLVDTEVTTEVTVNELTVANDSARLYFGNIIKIVSPDIVEKIIGVPLINKSNPKHYCY